MKTKEEDIKSVLSLPPFDGNCTVAWSGEGGGEVYRIWDTFFLFYIPQFGCDGEFKGSFDISEVRSLVNLAHSWT